MGVRDAYLDASNQIVRPGAALQIADYCRTITDRIRFDAYARALERLVTARSVVLNVDAGIGMTSLVACQLGARRCYAMDPSSIVLTLVDAVGENDLDDRVVVLQRRPGEVNPLEPVDIIVSDVPGTLSFPGTHLANLLDARTKWPEEIAFEAGDHVDVEIRADPICSDYIWTWTNRIRKSTGAAVAHFRQSTFFGGTLSPELVRKRVGDFVPVLSTEGHVVLDVLMSMRAGKDIATLARELLAAQPDTFRSLDDAHGFVAALVGAIQHLISTRLDDPHLSIPTGRCEKTWTSFAN